MKLTKLFIAILFIGTIFSCSNDENEENNEGNTDNIVGEWTLESIDYDTTSTVSGITTTGVGEAYDISGGINFTENPNEFTSDAQYSIHLTATTLGQDSTYDIPNLQALDQTGVWSVDGSELSVDDSSDTMITTFSNNGNTVRLDGSKTQTVQGVPTTVNVTFVLTK